MSRKKKLPLPPRNLRMNRSGRLRSAPKWLAQQQGRPAARIARSYRKRYGVDWECAIAELSLLGINFDAKWREEIARSLAAKRQADARRKAAKTAARGRAAFPESDATFAYIAGYTDGGAPYGTTWEEAAQFECDASIGLEPERKSELELEPEPHSEPS